MHQPVERAWSELARWIQNPQKGRTITFASSNWLLGIPHLAHQDRALYLTIVRDLTSILVRWVHIIYLLSWDEREGDALPRTHLGIRRIRGHTSGPSPAGATKWPPRGDMGATKWPPRGDTHPRIKRKNSSSRCRRCSEDPASRCCSSLVVRFQASSIEEPVRRQIASSRNPQNRGRTNTSIV